MKTELAKLANRLYDRAPSTHRRLYSLYKGWSDRAERAALRRLITPGMTVYDIGANIGIYTQFLAKLVGVSGRVVAFEPEHRNVERLRTATHQYHQVEVLHAAVSDRSGILKLYVAEDLNVDHRSYPCEGSRSFVEINAIALDDFAVDRGTVDVIKMDIQGAELAALRGARRMLSQNSPALLLEYWPYGLRSAGEDPRLLIEELETHGYNVRTIDDLPVPAGISDANPDVYLNLVALRRKTN